MILLRGSVLKKWRMMTQFIHKPIHSCVVNRKSGSVLTLTGLSVRFCAGVPQSRSLLLIREKIFPFFPCRLCCSQNLLVI
jgi:hypothetical protein